MRNLFDDAGATLGIGLLIVVAIYAVGIFLFYVVIRLAVRHGTLDAWRRLPGGPGRPGGRPDA